MIDLAPSSPLSLLAAPEIEAALRSGSLAEAEAHIGACDIEDGPAPKAVLQAALDYARAQIKVRRLENAAAAQDLGAVAARFQALGRTAPAAHCLGEQALCLALAHRPDEAQQALLLAEELLCLLPEAERLPVQALCQLAVGWTLLSRGALVEALGVFERAEGVVNDVVHPEGVALLVPWLLGMGQALRLLSLTERAAACLEQAARVARQARDPASEGIALGQLALCALYRGDFAAGRDHALRQVALARSILDRPAEARGRVILAEALLQLGRPEEALAEAGRGLAASAGQPPLQEVYAALLSARAKLALVGPPTAGARPPAATLDEAEPFLEQAERLLGGRDLGTAQLLHRACLALLRAYRGDAGALREADAEARAAMRRVPVPGAMADAFVLLGRAFRVGRSGRRAGARERRAQLCWELLAEPKATVVPEAPDAALLGPLGRAAQRTLLLRALTYDDEAEPALLLVMRSLPAQREALLRCAAELGCASAGAIGPLLGLVLEAPSDERAPDGRVLALRVAGQVLGARVAPLRGLLTDVGEVVLDSPAWAQLLGAP